MLEEIPTSTPVLDAILHRRSLRRYRPEPVAREIIQRLLTAAIWAPSAHNRQPWRFAVVQSSAQKEILAQTMGARLRRDLAVDHAPEDVIAADVGRSYERMTSAPVLIMLCLSMVDMDVYTDERRNQSEYLMAVQSTAMAGQNLLLAAHEAGLAACWMCAPLFCPDVVRDTLSLPEDWQPQGVLTLGYPAQEREKTRKPLESSVVWR
ncbi:MAG TPA: nitroreductase family protein [Phototrophicaceae bacterium]|jgi:F420 biosynthesis protein FbiB-like protein|nr:nitroreductase family protein [Phototrophicaceae bacterium]